MRIMLMLAALAAPFCGRAAITDEMVLIDGKFYIDKYEVTAEQFDKYCEATKSMKPFGEGVSKGKQPANQLTWWDAMNYAKWAGKRLPTADEWERAARGPEKLDQPVPLDKFAWFDKNSGGKPHPVGKKKPNGFGLYDMFGNVWEWCSGNVMNKDHKQIRGGSACQGADSAHAMSNSWNVSINRDACGGFRCVVDKDAIK